MRLVFFGSGDFGTATLQALYGRGHELLLVGTQPAKPAGRGRHPQPTPIARAAAALGLVCREFADINTPATAALLQELRPHAAVVIAFGQKISSGLLQLPGLRWINLHGSLLPSYRGAAPINWAIIQGERQAGVTVMAMNDVFDGGAIYAKAALEIGELETAGELHDRLAALGPGLMLGVLEAIEAGRDEPLAQDDTKASKAPKLHKADGRLDWTLSAELLARRCRGMYPWPGAFSFLHQQHKDEALRIIVARARAEGGRQARQAPGTLEADYRVACGMGCLEIVELVPPGGKLMTMKDFCNGRHIAPGDRLSPDA